MPSHHLSASTSALQPLHPRSYFDPVTPPPPMSPPTAFRQFRRPSISNATSAMSSWLGHKVTPSNSSNNYTPCAAPTPLRISEPQITSSLDLFALHPSVKSPGRSLGMGAQVVSTPEEALSAKYGEFESYLAFSTPNSPMFRSDSPPLPPIPGSPVAPLTSSSEPNLSLSHNSPPRPTRALPTPPAPLMTSTAPTPLRPALKPTSPPHSIEVSPANPRPSLLSPSVAPQFKAVLLSSCPDSVTDPSSVIVTLDTSTSSLRTTLATLLSRPSHLASYLNTLIPRDNLTAPPSPTSPFSVTYQTHLASVGCSTSYKALHIFLDRPSAPYAHVMTYLRGTTPTLPRGVHLQPQSNSKIEALLELRDEAIFLGLDELEMLCGDELTKRQGHVRNGSGSLEKVKERTSQHSPVMRKDRELSMLEQSHPSPTHVPELRSKLSSSALSRRILDADEEQRRGSLSQALRTRTRSNSRSKIEKPLSSGNWI